MVYENYDMIRGSLKLKIFQNFFFFEFFEPVYLIYL